MNKQIKGDKYIYLSMAYQLAKQNGGRVQVGHDNGRKGGQQFVRWFTINTNDSRTVLQETKTSASYADFSRYYLIFDLDKYIAVYELIEDGDNYSKNWIH